MRRYIERLVRETGAVHLKDGNGLRGILVAAHGDCIVLAEAKALGEGGEITADGRAVVLRENISWIQHLSAKDE